MVSNTLALAPALAPGTLRLKSGEGKINLRAAQNPTAGEPERYRTQQTRGTFALGKPPMATGGFSTMGLKFAKKSVGYVWLELAELRECRNHIVKKCCAGYAGCANANRGTVRKIVT